MRRSAWLAVTVNGGNVGGNGLGWAVQSARFRLLRLLPVAASAEFNGFRIVTAFQYP